jgi:hypothetical protein
LNLEDIEPLFLELLYRYRQECRLQNPDTTRYYDLLRLIEGLEKEFPEEIEAIYNKYK